MLSILRFIYTLGMVLALPAIFLRLIWRSFNYKAYRQRLLERIGVYPSTQITQNGLLLHAVSVGEVVAALPLINAIKARYPSLPITVTTTTPTGADRVRQSLGSSVTHLYMPYDMPWAVASLLNKVKPSCLVIMETELWPNLLHVAKQRGLPVLIANGRISDRSFRGYCKINWITQQILQRSVNLVAAQSQMDGDRFVTLGLPPEKLLVTGNLKFDMQVNESQAQAGLALKSSLTDRLIWVAASTHAGEEDQIIKIYQKLQPNFSNLLLILIPRHPDRFDQVADLLRSQGINFVRRSTKQNCTANTQVMLGDTMGELLTFYAAADIAFVGGSLVPIGGHNLLEPAVMNAPCITGSHLHNFKEISALLTQAHALQIVNNADELFTQLTELLKQLNLRQDMAKAASRVVTQNRGAVEKLLSEVTRYLQRAYTSP